MMQLPAFLGSESGTFNSLQSAVHFHQHIRRVLARFAATTVNRYITTFNNLARACEDLEVCILAITEVQAADILVTLQLQKREDPALGSSAVTCIKAIRWVRRHAQCNVFEAFFGELISSFLRSKLPKDRCESVPLLLFALVQWERRILQRNTPVVDVILLGAILLTAWASLHFSDSQRVEWSSFAFDIVSLRGVAYQTKVSHQGQPFGLITAGFLHHGSHSWVAKFSHGGSGCCKRLFAAVSPSSRAGAPESGPAISGLAKILQDHGGQHALSRHLLGAGTQSFEHVVCTASEFDGVLLEMFGGTAVPLMQRSKLRAVWSELQQPIPGPLLQPAASGATPKSDPGWSEAFAPILDAAVWSELQQPIPGPLLQPAASGATPKSDPGWSEAFAPILDAAKVASLKKAFFSAYPSEILSQENLVSNPLEKLHVTAGV
eukprot:s8930_g1.t1